MGQWPLKYLLDSNVLIDHFNGRQEATRFLEANADQSTLSVISRAEIMSSFEGPSAVTASRLLDSFQTLDIHKGIADLAAKLRREHGWKLPDAFQAAIAKHHGLKLVTRNTKDFSPAKHAFVLIPYK